MPPANNYLRITLRMTLGATSRREKPAARCQSAEVWTRVINASSGIHVPRLRMISTGWPKAAIHIQSAMNSVEKREYVSDARAFHPRYASRMLPHSLLASSIQPGRS